MPITATGSQRDRELKSFVESPSRIDFTAQEVYVGNSSSDPVPVVFSGRGQTKNIYNEVMVPAASDVAVNTYIVPLTKGATELKVFLSGDCRSVITLTIDGTVILKKRLYDTFYNLDLNLGEFEFSQGQNISVFAENVTSNNGTFNATFNLSEFDL